MIHEKILKHPSYKAIIGYNGEPDFVIDGCPVWMFTTHLGQIFDGEDFMPIAVNEEEKIFDVNWEGKYIDWGENYFNAWQEYTVEKELLYGK